ncbi:MAG: hypothetical protein IPN15_08990 [Saprospiraceae bacterium]|nr:hypothetical protein [Candidatus Vicinibacter affinis]MBK7694815.1 hypothetical protein [Candidatus Vicinibacter affinis]MBK8642329.1 hypothetical protein [Candidatus Vicinibacter affinis]
MTLVGYSELSVAIITALVSILIPTKSIESKWIRLYCLLNVILDFVAFILARKGIINIPVVYLLIWVEVFILLQYFFIILYPSTKILKFRLYLIIYLIFIGILVFFESFFAFNPYTQIFEGIIIFICCVIYLQKQLKTPTVPFIYEVPNFWFVSGFLIYYGCTWLMLSTIEYFIIDPKLFKYIWDYQNILSILKNIAIIIGFICLKKN